MGKEELTMEAMIERFQKRLEWQKTHGRPRSKQIYTKCMMDYYNRVKEAQDQGKPLAITSIRFGSEVVVKGGAWISDARDVRIPKKNICLTPYHRQCYRHPLC